jgi:hypothetical protein
MDILMVASMVTPMEMERGVLMDSQMALMKVCKME